MFGGSEAPGCPALSRGPVCVVGVAPAFRSLKNGAFCPKAGVRVRGSGGAVPPPVLPPGGAGGAGGGDLSAL